MNKALSDLTFTVHTLRCINVYPTFWLEGPAVKTDWRLENVVSSDHRLVLGKSAGRLGLYL